MIARLFRSVSVVSRQDKSIDVGLHDFIHGELLPERLARPMERLNLGAMRQGCWISRSSEKQNFLQSIVPIPAFRLYNIAHSQRFEFRPKGDNQTPRRLN